MRLPQEARKKQVPGTRLSILGSTALLGLPEGGGLGLDSEVHTLEAWG